MGEGGTVQGPLHATVGPPPGAKALGHPGYKDIPVSEVPAVEKGGGLEEVAWVVEEEGSFKECLGEIGAGPRQGRILRDDEFPHDVLWERERPREGGPTEVSGEQSQE